MSNLNMPSAAQFMPKTKKPQKWYTGAPHPSNNDKERHFKPHYLSDLEVTHTDLQEAINAAREWQQRRKEHPGASLLLLGETGTGKTHIALSALTCFALKLDGEIIGHSGRFYTATDLLAKYNSGSDIVTKTGHFIRDDCPLVVIDDVGTEMKLPYIAEVAQQNEIRNRYYRFIDYCYTNEISVIMTCNNLDIDGLGEYLGDRNWSRLGQMAPEGFVCDLYDVPDYRTAKSGRSKESQ